MTKVGSYVSVYYDTVTPQSCHLHTLINISCDISPQINMPIDHILHYGKINDIPNYVGRNMPHTYIYYD